MSAVILFPEMEPVYIFALLALCCSATGFGMYFRALFKGEAKPHAYTWFTWAITQGTATAAMIYGGAQWGAVQPAFGTVLLVVVFVLAFKYGTRDVTLTDTLFLLSAFIAIGLWVFAKSPLLSVMLVTATDLIGFAPTFRKSYRAPWSEPLTSYVIFTAGNAFSLLALREHNALTMTYLPALMMANIALVGMCLVRRRATRRR